MDKLTSCTQLPVMAPSGHRPFGSVMRTAQFLQRLEWRMNFLIHLVYEVFCAQNLKKMYIYRDSPFQESERSIL